MAHLRNCALGLAALLAPSGCFTCRCGPGETDAGRDGGPGECGRVEWSAADPDVEPVLPRSVVLLPSGDVVVGSAYGAPDTPATPADRLSYQLRRLDGATGEVLWSRVVPGPVRLHSLTLAIAPGGALVMAADSPVEADLGSGTMVPPGLLLATYDAASGALLRSFPLPSSGFLRTFDLAVDDAGFAYVVGDFTSVFDLPGVAATPANDAFDGFIVRLNLGDGSPAWGRAFGGELDDRPYGVVADAEGGAALTSVFFGPLEIGGKVLQALEPETSSFVARFDPDGNVSWVTQIDGTVSYFIDRNAAGDYYALGFLRADFLWVDGSPETVPGQEDGRAVLTKLASDGTYLWSRRLASGGDDPIGAPGLRVDPGGTATVLFTGTGLALETGPALDPGVSGFAVARLSAEGELTATWGLPTGMSGVTGPETVIGALAVDRCAVVAAVLYRSSEGLPELPPPVPGPDLDGDAVVFRLQP